MRTRLKSKIQTNLWLNIISLLCGFIFWFIFGAAYQGSFTTDVPLCFYGDIDGKEIIAPTMVTVELAGKRSDLYTLDVNKIALHIDADELRYGDQLAPVTSEHLLLPSSIKLVNWSPKNLIIAVKEKIA